MYQLNFPLIWFEYYFKQILQGPISRCICPAVLQQKTLFIATPGSSIQTMLLLIHTDNFILPQQIPSNCLGILYIGRRTQQSRIYGWVRNKDNFVPFYSVHFIGSGMHTVYLEQEVTEPVELPHHTRTIGVLGLNAWKRLTNLHFGVIGLGRNGSYIALSLARLGVKRLTLIDPDKIELHNLGEMQGVNKKDIEKTKVEVMSHLIQEQAFIAPEIVSVMNSITKVQALQSIQNCDFLLGCVDHDSARIVVSAIATVFNKPLIDIASGIHDNAKNRNMGADVRLVLPGKCLLCLGGLRSHIQALQVLSSTTSENLFYEKRQWQEDRRGSLASLNQFATAIAMRLLEDLVMEKIQTSIWLHSEFDDNGHIHITYPENSDSPCAICKFGGWGENNIRDVIKTIYSQEKI